MNNITVAGSLGKDAEIRYLPNGDAVCNFSVADSTGKDKPTIWWNCQMYGKRGESLSQYLLKGTSVCVSGSVTEREWKDKEGNTRKSMDLRVADVSLQGSRKEQAPETSRKMDAAKARQLPKQSSGFDDMDDNSVPF